jgi:hypothetical protein
MTSLRAQWTNNHQQDRWEAVIDGHLAVARFDRLTHRYMAYIDSRDERAPDHYAAESFSDPEAAKAWCEAEVARITAEERPTRTMAQQLGQMLRKPDPEL